ncbi:hypothetical protein [Polyangium fumosum]|uniref:Tetratricopeptide repeat protein n=1 Tax=Polyangium fumosum TaxID=889272 RepID=A0A4U1IUP9_9BACT|nr:hypothetical protein [Polyangium fumosum]TKC98158.1 hypothetical protein E8A74_42275 [Polyangium fumosum]
MDPRDAWLPPDTIAEHGRVRRPPLRAWASNLIDRMNALEPGNAGFLCIEECSNNTGLIEVYRGRTGAAAEVCARQLDWAGRLVRQRGVMAAGERLLQPWINLGRLRRIAGDHEAALAHFALVVETLSGRPVRLGKVEIDAASWQALVQHRSLSDLLRNVYVVDSVKTYFVARDLGGALDFLRRARSLCGEQPFPLLDEVELLTLARLEKFEEAAVLLWSDAWNISGFHKLLRVTYRVGLHAASGELSRCQRLIEDLAVRVPRMRGLAAPDDPCILRYLYYLGGLASRLGLDMRAAQIFRLGLGAAEHVDDVPCRLAFLDALIDTAVEDSVELAAARDALLRDCLYVPILKARGLPVDPAALADPVFDELHDKLRNATEDREDVPSPEPSPGAIPVR